MSEHLEAPGATTKKLGPNEMGDTWRRFCAHWIAATFGYFLRSLLPVLKSWLDPRTPVEFPRWWAALIFAACICFVGNVINSNLPVRPRELVKSICLGFALDGFILLAQHGL
jgi:hypothetical protein